MGYPREVIEQVKKAVCKEAMEMRQLNHVVPVTGKAVADRTSGPADRGCILSGKNRACTAHTGIPRRWIPVWRLCPK